MTRTYLATHSLERLIHPTIFRFAPALLSGLLLLLVWQALTDAALIPSYLLPSPVDIAASLWQQSDLLAQHTFATLTTALAGLLLAIVFATTCAFFMQRIPLLGTIIQPWMVVSQAVPIIFLYPLVLLWLGFGDTPRIFIVALMCFFPIAVNLSDALKRCNPDLLLALASMGIGKTKLLLYVRFMAALPDYFSGLKIATTYCLMGAVIAEWLGASQGLGVYMLRAYKSFAPDRVFAAILLAVALTLLLTGSVRLIEHLLTPSLRIKR